MGVKRARCIYNEIRKCSDSYTYSIYYILYTLESAQLFERAGCIYNQAPQIETSHSLGADVDDIENEAYRHGRHGRLPGCREYGGQVIWKKRD
jgi:hypothetical protein